MHSFCMNMKFFKQKYIFIDFSIKQLKVILRFKNDLLRYVQRTFLHKKIIFHIFYTEQFSQYKPINTSSLKKNQLLQRQQLFFQNIKEPFKRKIHESENKTLYLSNYFGVYRHFFQSFCRRMFFQIKNLFNNKNKFTLYMGEILLNEFCICYI